VKNSWLPGFIGFIGILLVLFAIIGFYAASKLKSGVLFCNGCCLAVVAVLMLGFGIFCLADRCVLLPSRVLPAHLVPIGACCSPSGLDSVCLASPSTPVSRRVRERERASERETDRERERERRREREKERERDRQADRQTDRQRERESRGVRRVAEGRRGACACSKDAQELVKQELPLIVERFVNVCPHCCLNASKTVTEETCPVSA
jgi:hypothetical protein